MLLGWCNRSCLRKKMRYFTCMRNDIYTVLVYCKYLVYKETKKDPAEAG